MIPHPSHQRPVGGPLRQAVRVRVAQPGGDTPGQGLDLRQIVAGALRQPRFPGGVVGQHHQAAERRVQFVGLMGQGRRHLVEPFTAAGQFQQPVVLTLLLAGQALDHLAQGGQQQRQGDEDHAHAETVGVAQLPGQGVQGGMRRRGAVPQGGQQVSTQRHHQQPERGAAPQGQRAEQQRHQQIERQRVTGAAQLLQQADEDHHVQGQFQGQQALLPAGIEAGQGDQVG